MVTKLRKFIKSLSKYMLAYDIVMVILSISVIFGLVIETKLELTDFELTVIDCFVNLAWAIFCIDYMVRLIIAKNRLLFIRKNIIDLIAIISFGTLFQGSRAIKIIRLLYILKAFAYLNRIYERIISIIKTNDFDHILWFTLGVIFIGAVSISFVDGLDMGDALWWSFVTTATVGYGDIAPHSIGGRLIAVFLMIIGIGFLSTLTGTISAFFIHHVRANKKVTYKDEEIERVIDKLNNFDALSTDDLNQMFSVLKALKENT